MAEIEFARGTVWLVGAGPGDPDLLTRKAERLMREASVIFHDALVGAGILALVPSHVRLVSVGKRSGRHSKDQKTISALLVEAALAGERVLRLKGGDPGIFGRAAEELNACHAAGVRVHICPGLTAASAAAASLGRSLTLRGLARRLTFVTAHTTSGAALDLDWEKLADPQATLAVYMCKAAAPQVAAGLIAAGMPPDTPIALVENASLAEERQVVTRLDLLPLTARSSLGNGPAVILIGRAICPAAERDQPAGHASRAHRNESAKQS